MNITLQIHISMGKGGFIGRWHHYYCYVKIVDSETLLLSAFNIAKNKVQMHSQQQNKTPSQKKVYFQL